MQNPDIVYIVQTKMASPMLGREEYFKVRHTNVWKWFSKQILKKKPNNISIYKLITDKC